VKLRAENTKHAHMHPVCGSQIPTMHVISDVSLFSQCVIKIILTDHACHL
jgi:hypothetical protein